MRKVVLITGASSGFGKAVAKKFLENGHTVYAVARRTEKMEDLRLLGAEVFFMDVTKSEIITDVVNTIINKHGLIDVLVNNAGYGSYGMIEAVPIEEAKYQYEVNLFGVVRLIKEVLPYMRKQRNGRIIITSSLVSNLSSIGIGWYASTKHAIKALATSLRQEVKSLGIDVVLVEPGVVETEFAQVSTAKIKELTVPEDYKIINNSFQNFLNLSHKNAPSPEKTATLMYKAATVKKPKLIYRTTWDSKILPILTVHISTRFYDFIVSKIMKK